MPPALLTGTKGFWRKKLSKEPEKYYSAQASQPLADDVVTLIVIGCGQRGKVRRGSQKDNWAFIRMLITIL